MEKSSKKADKNRFLDYALRAPLEMTKWDALQPSPHFSVARGVPEADVNPKVWTVLPYLF